MGSICFGVISLLKVSISVALFQLEQRSGTSKGSTTKLRYFWKIFKQLLYDLLHFLPLFLTNAAFNILTMDLFLNYCQRSGMVWLAFVYFIPLMCFNLFMLKDIGEISFLTRLHIAWVSLFVLAVPTKGRSKMVITMVVILQLGHFFVNIAALLVYLLSYPSDYLVIIGVAGVGVLSLLPLTCEMWINWRKETYEKMK